MKIVDFILKFVTGENMGALLCSAMYMELILENRFQILPLLSQFSNLGA